jgi:hypothetical protein
MMPLYEYLVRQDGRFVELARSRRVRTQRGLGTVLRAWINDALILEVRIEGAAETIEGPAKTRFVASQVSFVDADAQALLQDLERTPDGTRLVEEFKRSNHLAVPQVPLEELQAAQHRREGEERRRLIE